MLDGTYFLYSPTRSYFEGKRLELPTMKMNRWTEKGTSSCLLFLCTGNKPTVEARFQLVNGEGYMIIVLCAGSPGWAD